MEEFKEDLETGIVYLILNTSNLDDFLFRVGKSKNTDLSRPKQQQAYLPFKTEVFVFHSNNYNDLETRVHRALKKFKTNGDWYKCDITEIISALCNDYTVFKCDLPSVLSIFKNKLSVKS